MTSQLPHGEYQYCEFLCLRSGVCSEMTQLEMPAASSPSPAPVGRYASPWSRFACAAFESAAENKPRNTPNSNAFPTSSLCSGVKLRVRLVPGLTGVGVRQVTRDKETAVRIEAHWPQSAVSSRSSRTKFGITRRPKIRRARASTSGHLTRRFLFFAARGFSSSSKTASKNFSLARRGIAWTCFSNLTALTRKQ